MPLFTQANFLQNALGVFIGFVNRMLFYFVQHHDKCRRVCYYYNSTPVN